MEDVDWRWRSVGLHRFQIVRCEVTAHRGRFGVDVNITSPISGISAFIDFVMLSDEGHTAPEGFPVIGSRLDAVTIDFMPDGELRLSSRQSSLARARSRNF